MLSPIEMQEIAPLSQLVVWKESGNRENCVWAERRGAGEEVGSGPRCVRVHWTCMYVNNSEK